MSKNDKICKNIQNKTLYFKFIVYNSNLLLTKLFFDYLKKTFKYI